MSWEAAVVVCDGGAAPSGLGDVDGLLQRSSSSKKSSGSPRCPRPPSRLQLRRAAVDLLVHDDDLVARVLQLWMKIGAIPWVI
jgi:hypothetical protein